MIRHTQHGTAFPSPRVGTRTAFFLMALLTLVACSDSAAPDGGDGRELLANPSFTSDINEIFVRRGCTSGACHGSPGGQAGLTLSSDPAVSYAELVNVPATREPFQRVLPGNADDSYLVIKLEGRQSVGDPMPLNGSPLDAVDLGNIRNWIGNGAPEG